MQNTTVIKDNHNIAEILQEGYGFYLEGKVQENLLSWRSGSETSQIEALEQAALMLEKLISDVKEHGTPQCTM